MQRSTQIFSILFPQGRAAGCMDRSALHSSAVREGSEMSLPLTGRIHTKTGYRRFHTDPEEHPGGYSANFLYELVRQRHYHHELRDGEAYSEPFDVHSAILWKAPFFDEVMHAYRIRVWQIQILGPNKEYRAVCVARQEFLQLLLGFDCALAEQLEKHILFELRHRGLVLLYVWAVEVLLEQGEMRHERISCTVGSARSAIAKFVQLRQNQAHILPLSRHLL